MKFNKSLFFLLLILLLATFLRFYKLSEIPNGFNQDESAIGYNAYSILKTGKDEYGKPYPVYFKSFGDQKLPVYIYMTVVSEKFFGLNKFAVRFPSALLGALTVLIVFFMVKEISQNKKLAMISSGLLAINPWNLFFSRAAFEDNIALAFAVFSTWVFFYTMHSKKWLYLFLSILGFALSLYSYNVTRLLAPTFLICLIWINWHTAKYIPNKMKISAILCMFILSLPFLLTFFTRAGASSASGALITSTDIQAKGLEMRSYLVGSADSIGKIFFDKYIFMVWQYLENLVSVISVSFFFVSGSQHGSQGIGNVGTFYLLEFPLIITGIYLILNKKIKQLYFFILWTIIALAVLSLSKEVPHATRGYFLVVPFEVFSAVGVLAIIEKLRKMKGIKRKSLIYICLVLATIYNLVFYFSSYYFRFPRYYASGWRQQDEPLTKFIKQNESKYNKVIIDTNAGFIYTSLAFFSAYDPQTFQKTVKRTTDDTEGFNQVISFGKYEWKNVDWSLDGNDVHNLIILPERKVPSDITPLAVFKYPTIPEVLSFKETIAQYPVQDTVYVAVQPKSKPVSPIKEMLDSSL